MHGMGIHQNSLASNIIKRATNFILMVRHGVYIIL